MARKRLAEIAETKLKGHAVDLDELREEIAPVFRKRDGQQTDVVVLGCTHYPLLVEDMLKVQPWLVNYIDPAPAIARRVADVLDETPLKDAGKTVPPHNSVLLTAARVRPPNSLAAYAAMGFDHPEFLDLPV